MPIPDIRRRSGLLLLALAVGHIVLISAQVNTRSGVPVLQAFVFGVFAEVQRGTAAVFGGVRRTWGEYARAEVRARRQPGAEAAGPRTAGGHSARARTGGGGREPPAAARLARPQPDADARRRSDRDEPDRRLPERHHRPRHERRRADRHGGRLPGRSRRPCRDAVAARGQGAAPDRSGRGGGRDGGGDPGTGHRERHRPEPAEPRIPERDGHDPDGRRRRHLRDRRHLPRRIRGRARRADRPGGRPVPIGQRPAGRGLLGARARAGGDGARLRRTQTVRLRRASAAAPARQGRSGARK